MNYPEEITRLAERLKGPLPGLSAQELMTGRVLPMPENIPGDARPSAVLALLFPKDGALHALFIRRTADGHAHSGQISFPGGRQETSDADLTATALRETQEEVGIASGDIGVLGALSPLYIPVSNFMVYPFVGFCAAPPVYRLSTREVAAVLEVPLAHLFHADHKTNTVVRPSSAPQLQLNVPAYLLQDKAVLWGATAMILSELEVLWKEINR